MIIRVVLLLWLIVVFFLNTGAFVGKNGVALVQVRLRATLAVFADNDLRARAELRLLVDGLLLLETSGVAAAQRGPILQTLA